MYMYMLMVNWHGKEMATTKRNTKWKSQATLTIKEFKFRGWWIQGEWGPTALPKHCVQLFVGKEPIATNPNKGLNFQ
jgi:hypothetical protein